MYWFGKITPKYILKLYFKKQSTVHVCRKLLFTYKEKHACVFIFVGICIRCIMCIGIHILYILIRRNIHPYLHMYISAIKQIHRNWKVSSSVEGIWVRRLNFYYLSICTSTFLYHEKIGRHLKKKSTQWVLLHIMNISPRCAQSVMGPQRRSSPIRSVRVTEITKGCQGALTLESSRTGGH